MAKGSKDTNTIGDNGERFAAIRLTQGQLFDVITIGAKALALDLLCRINDENKPYQFLVQVKATETIPTYTKKTPYRIKTPVPTQNYKTLQKLPLPTYVAGVDNNKGDVFIAPAFELEDNYAGSIPTTYVLSQSNLTASLNNLNKLKQDVIDYWDGLSIQDYKSFFISALI